MGEALNPATGEPMDLSGIPGEWGLKVSGGCKNEGTDINIR
jgi:hypothetical protein